MLKKILFVPICVLLAILISILLNSSNIDRISLEDNLPIFAMLIGLIGLPPFCRADINPKIEAIALGVVVTLVFTSVIIKSNFGVLICLFYPILFHLAYLSGRKAYLKNAEEAQKLESVYKQYKKETAELETPDPEENDPPQPFGKEWMIDINCSSLSDEDIEYLAKEEQKLFARIKKNVVDERNKVLAIIKEQPQTGEIKASVLTKATTVGKKIFKNAVMSRLTGIVQSDRETGQAGRNCRTV